MMNEHDEDEDDFGLVMPFIVCKSNGGEFDDTAFTVGYELGMINAELHYASVSPQGLPSLPAARYVHTAGVNQLDLIAMRHGFMVEIGGEDQSGDWTWVVFKPQV